jgi:anthranilate phosphoribosyltransferase
VTLDLDEPVLDTCGTGGDSSGSFNVSTVVAIVVAACGVRVAKHGNRAVSSSCGSADVLEALGVRLDQDATQIRRSVRDVGIGFLFAPHHHAALRHAAAVRRELGARTIFNLLGPLSNPAGATHQLVGVYDATLVPVLAEVLGRLGLKRAWVVHGEGGLDEVSPAGETRVAEWDGHAVRERTVTPADFGLAPAALAELAGGDAPTNATMVRSVLRGDAGAPRTAVLMGAGAALAMAWGTDDLRGTTARAAAAIDDGSAARLLERWVASPATDDASFEEPEAP